MKNHAGHLFAGAMVCTIVLAGCNRANLVLRDVQTQQPIAQARVFVHTGKADVPFNARATTDSEGIAQFTHPSSVGTLFATVRTQEPGVPNWGQFNPGHGEWRRLYQEGGPGGLSGMEGRLESPASEVKP